MMKKNVEPKLKFEVGEKVVICGSDQYFNSTKSYPNTDDFAFTTIKEVRADGSVVVEEGYRFRQAYETYYGETTFFDYFRIDVAKDVKLNSKQYKKVNRLAKICDTCSFCYGPTYLFKMSKGFEEKVIQFEKENEERLVKENEEEVQRAKRQVFKDAYKNELEPFEREFEEKKAELFAKHFCSKCTYNCNGHCSQWGYEVNSHCTSCCSAWKVR